MSNRTITHETVLDVPPERAFALLHTPSAIRGWWSASTAIVIPEPGGVYALTWGEEEDDPDYVTVATIRAFEPPRVLELGDYRYRTKTGELPFEADFSVRFEVEPKDGGSLLRVHNHGFPTDPTADEFYAGCEQGWKDTFLGIERFVAGE